MLLNYKNSTKLGGSSSRVSNSLAHSYAHEIIGKWQHSQIGGQVLRDILAHEIMPSKSLSYLKFINKHYFEIVSCKIKPNKTLHIIK